MTTTASSKVHTSPSLFVHEWLAVLTILGFLILLLSITLRSKFNDDFVQTATDFQNMRTVTKTGKKRVSKPRVSRTRQKPKA